MSPSERYRRRRSKIIALDRRGMSPKDIAPLVGVGVSRVHQILRDPPPTYSTGTIDRYELARRRKHNIGVYVKRGLETKDIAPLVGVSEGRVNQIRRELGCPPVHPWRCQKAWSPRKDPRIGEMTRLWREGLTDKEMAARLGVCRRTIERWRRRLDIPVQSKKPLWSSQQAVMDVFREHGPRLTIAEVARLLDIDIRAAAKRLERLRKGRFLEVVVRGGKSRPGVWQRTDEDDGRRRCDECRRPVPPDASPRTRICGRKACVDKRLKRQRREARQRARAKGTT